jgi:thioredoxin 1
VTWVLPAKVYERPNRKSTLKERQVLQTNLTHILTEAEFRETLEKNENVMICCGRMGPMCIPVYGVMEELEEQYRHVAFRDMEFDGPIGHLIRSLPECSSFRGLPFTVYFKNGKPVQATSSIQNMDQVTEILEKRFGAAGQK